MNSSHYTFEPLAEGVLFARSRPGGGSLCNSGLVDLGEEMLVFDTSLTPTAARDLRAASEEVLGRPPSVAANSHRHLDHVLGNQVFARLPTYGTRRTRDLLVERHDALMAEVSVEAMEKAVHDLEGMVQSAPSAALRGYFQSVLDTHRWVLADAASIQLTPPNRTFEEKLPFPGQREACLRTFGSGHTESDAVLHLPHEGLLFAGDLIVVGTHPNLTSGDPEHWLTVLEEIERLRPERIVPGHGPVASPEAIESVRDYLRTLLALADSPGTPAIPARFSDWTEGDQFGENLKFLRSRLPR